MEDNLYPINFLFLEYSIYLMIVELEGVWTDIFVSEEDIEESQSSVLRSYVAFTNNW